MGGLGGRARNKWLADIVTFKSPEAARRAASHMERLYGQAKGMPGKVLIWRSANLAEQRAQANARNPRSTPKRRMQMRSIARSYGQIVDKHRRHVNQKAPRSDPKISKSYYRGGVRR